MNIKEIFQRNAPVFVIGGITVLIFVFIIVSAQNRPIDNTQLIEVDNIDLVAPHTYIKGPIGAPVDVVEFTDFGCPACKQAHPIIQSIYSDYSQYMRWGVRHFPLPQHKNADKAAIAAQAAGEQGRFWEYADVLYTNQGNFSDADLVNYADYLGLDLEKFRNDYNSNAFKEIVEEDIKYGRQIGINATPTFFVNGKQVIITDENSLRSAVEKAIRDSGVALDRINQEQQQKTDEIEQMSITDIYSAVDETYTPVEISYTDENGLEPKVVAAHAGQLVKWTNNTDREITFRQLMPKYDELRTPFAIQPGETFEFRLKFRISGTWTYDIDSEKTGTIRVNSIPEEIVDMLPEAME